MLHYKVDQSNDVARKNSGRRFGFREFPVNFWLLGALLDFYNRDEFASGGLNPEPPKYFHRPISLSWTKTSSQVAYIATCVVYFQLDPFYSLPNNEVFVSTSNLSRSCLGLQKVDAVFTDSIPSIWPQLR